MQVMRHGCRPLALGALLVAAVTTVCAPALAQSSGADTGFKFSGDQPVQIEGDELEVLDDQNRAVFTGNVKVEQGKTVLRTGKLVIFYSGSGSGDSTSTMMSGVSDIQRLEASGGVNIQSDNQVATGDQGTYDMSSKTLELTGKQVTLTQEGNVATGCKLTVATRTGRAKLEGCGGSSRPTILLQPNSVKNN